MQYRPERASVEGHPLPRWFHDAKFGIFIHWGLYSVPAWAPNAPELDLDADEHDWAGWFAHNPYAEWYMNTYRIEGSPTRAYHDKTFGADFDYGNFASMFNVASAAWDPEPWADLFKQANASYVVLTTKHHDGFLLWPSQTPNPFIDGYHAKRDLVGELCDAVREREMTMGLYYSGGLDWTFNEKVIQHITDFQGAIPQSDEYVAYANGHWRELIERYQTAVLWNDIAYPKATDLNVLFSDYYNALPDGVINNRFTQEFRISEGEMHSDAHHDFVTPEYTSYPEIRAEKWESCRGIGASFGYNRIEGPEQYRSTTELVHSLVDIVSKNGNLLLNVGPMADGTIPELQRERLLGIGRWLDVNGEAIFETRPWHTAEGTSSASIGLRFTQKDQSLYATFLGRPEPGYVALNNLVAEAETDCELLGFGQVAWEQRGNSLAVDLPDAMADAPAYSLRITPQPRLVT